MRKIFFILLLIFILSIIANIVFADEGKKEKKHFKEKFVIALQEKGIPKEIIVITISMLPIFELRGAIPIGQKILGLSWWFTFILAFIGNMLPIPFILLFLEPVSKWLRKIVIFDRFLEWLFARTRKRSEIIRKYEALGLILFVAIPLPITGAWTGSVAAFLFGIRFYNAILAISMGVFIAGCIVTALTVLGVWGAIIAGVLLSGLALSSFWKMFKKQDN